MEETMKKIVSLAKRRGFVFPSSDIYGGVEALWDYGPLGALMKRNIKEQWVRRFVGQMNSVVLLDSSILMHPRVWEASGHVENFTDPLVEDKKTHERYRLDHLLEEKGIEADGKTMDEMMEMIKKEKIKSPKGNDLTEPKQFNLMFKTFLGPIQDQAHSTHLRPETAQAMFTNFKLIQESQRLKVPFGIAQAGKAFRNEITTGHFTFRSREFEIAEIEFFVKPGEDDKWFDFWVEAWEQFFIDMGLKKENLRRYEHPKEALAHYSKRTIDIEYKFPFGWKEIAGIANRTDFDLKRHMEFSGQDLQYYDEETKEKYTPYVIEPTLGVERLLLALLCDAYEESEGGRGDEKNEPARNASSSDAGGAKNETVLRLSPKIAPIQVAILPLVKNKPDITAKAQEVHGLLQKHFVCQYDEVASVGRRYRRQDEIGTPYCVTIDFDSLENNDVTIRDRDTMKQERVDITNLVGVLAEKIYG